MGSEGTFVSYYYYYNSYYAFLAASAPQLLSFTRQTDKALSSPRFLLSHLHRKLSSLSLSLSLVLPIPKPICCFLFLIKEERKRYAIGGVEPNLLLQGSTRPRHLLQLSSPSCYSLQGFLLLSLSQLFFPFFLCVDVE
jgi:hypothetical protein